MNEWITKGMNEWITKGMNELMNEWMNDLGLFARPGWKTALPASKGITGAGGHFKSIDSRIFKDWRIFVHGFTSNYT